MIRSIKIWWILHVLKKSTIPSSKNIERDHILVSTVSKIKFVETLASHKIKKSFQRSICYRCEPDQYRTFQEKYAKQITKKMDEYYDLLTLCEKKGFISEYSNESTICSKNIRVSDKGLEYLGLFDLIETLLKQYKRIWIFILIPLLPWIINLVKGLIRDVHM